MMAEGPDEVSSILEAVRHGDADAERRLLGLVYDELRGMARRQLSKESHEDTLQTTGLVHEAYLRLFGGKDVGWENRRHFFGAAAQAMRRILIDRARERATRKRNWGNQRITLNDNLPDAEPPADLIALDEALNRLSEEHPRQAEVVKLRYFLGLTADETAELMQVARRTVQYDWQLAKAWLQREVLRT